MTNFETEAIWNSYKVITRIMTLYDLMVLKPESIIPFAHDPESDLSIDDLDRIIYALEDFEEYECCSRLNTIKNEIQRLSRGNHKSVDDHLIYGDICLPGDGSSYWEDFNEPWYLPKVESKESVIPDKEEGNIFSSKGLRSLISRLFNRGNKL